MCKWFKHDVLAHRDKKLRALQAKHGRILIVSSNLSRDELERYGERTFDRIRSGLRRIEIRGKSLRKTAR